MREGLSGESLVYNPGPRFILMTILTLTTGSAFIMWLGEQISDRGIGNGMSLIIFAGIVVGLPRAVTSLWNMATTGQWGSFTGIALIALIALMIAVVAFHRVCGGRSAAYSGSIRQARDGTQGNGWADDVFAVASELRRRHPADFREFAAHVPTDSGADFSEQVADSLTSSRSPSPGASLCTRSFM